MSNSCNKVQALQLKLGNKHVVSFCFGLAWKSQMMEKDEEIRKEILIFSLIKYGRISSTHFSHLISRVCLETIYFIIH